MKTFTYTKEQAQNIVNQWNELSDHNHQLKAEECYLIFDGNDNFDADLNESGATLIEVPANQSRSGNPATFYIYAEDLSAHEAAQ